MIKAIKVLEKRIETLNKELSKVKKDMEEPETLGTYEFSLNTAGNIELEIIELEKAIEILSKHITPSQAI